MNQYDDDDDDAEIGTPVEMIAIVPTPAQWAAAACLQLRPNDCVGDMEMDDQETHISRQDHVRIYGVELVYRDDTMDWLYVGRDLDEAKTMIQSAVAKHALTIRRLPSDQSDIEGY